MTRNARAIAVLTTMLGLAGCSAVQPVSPPVPRSTFSTQNVDGPKELLVKFRVQATPQMVDTFGAEHGLRPRDVIEALDVHVMTILTGEEATAMASRIKASSLVEYAEPNHRLRLQ